MRYIKLEHNQPINYSIEKLITDYPDAVIYSNRLAMPDAQLLAKHNVYQLVTNNPPVVSETQTAEEGPPALYNGEWHQTWITRDLTLAEIDQIIATRITIPADADVAIRFFSSEETIAQRAELCNNCPSYSTLKTCAECGYIMPLKFNIKDESCPIGKW